MRDHDASATSAVAAVLRFTTDGDTASNQELVYAIDHSLDVSGTLSVDTIAPQLLRWALDEYATHASPAVVVYVSVLNRYFCVRVILDRLAQPLDRRPAGLQALLELYVTALRGASVEAACRQLTQCVACLLISQEDHLTERLHAWIRGGDTSSELESRIALRTFAAVTDLLADRRVAIGSIRRATQRRQIQEHLLMVLESPLRDEADLPLLVRVTDTAVRFLLEAMYGEPQEVAATFWEALPASTVWQYCLHCLRASASAAFPQATCPEDVLSLVCNVLRCQTTVNAPAKALLMSALPLVLQPSPSSSPATVDWEMISHVISAAFEASTQAIVTGQPNDTTLFTLFSSAADQLAQILQSPAAPATAVCHVCEGLSALTQALQPTPLPQMEPDDDPDDFAFFTEDTRTVNTEKAAAVAQLSSFLHGCTKALAARLTHSGFTKEDWESIAAYVGRRAADGAAEDYNVSHGEVPLSAFTTYERLTSLLGALSVDEINAVTSDSGQQLVLVIVDPGLAFTWLESARPASLLMQSALLRCCVIRYVSSTSPSGWAVGSLAVRVMDLLTHALATYQEREELWGDGSASGHIAAIMDVAGASAAVVLAIAARLGRDGAARLRDQSRPLVTILWRCVTLSSGLSLPALLRHTAADELVKLLEAGVAVLPQTAIDQLKHEDAYTQAILFATGGATTSCLNTLETLAHVLDCVAQLSSAEEVESMETRVCCCLAERSRSQCEAGQWSGEALAALLDSWHGQHPELLMCFLHLSVAVPAEMQPTLLLAGITRFFSRPQSQNTSTRELVAALEPRFVRPIAASPVTASSFHALLQWLLQSHPSFTAADGARRVRTLAGCGRVLCECGQVTALSLTETLVFCVARWQEYMFSSAVGDGEASEAGEEDDTACEAQLKQELLEELAVWSRCVGDVPGIPENTPRWLAQLHSAHDDYERMEVLRNL